VWLGRLALTLPDLAAALDFFNQALELAPDDPAVLAWLGDAQRRAGHLDEARSSLLKAHSLVPDDIVVACKLSNCQIDLGDLAPAIELLSETLRSSPDVAELYLLRGLTYRQLRKNEEAESDLKFCLGLKPGVASALAALGDICRERRQLDVASGYIEQAVLADPDDASVLRARADLLAARKDWQEAVALYEKVLQRDPHDTSVVLSRATALIELGRAVEAIDALESCLSAGATEAWVYEMVGLLFAFRGEWQVALDNLEKAVEQAPESVNAWNTMIVAYNKSGQLEKAERAAAKALELAPRHVSALTNLANVRLAQGGHDEALELYRRALELNPGNVVASTGGMYGLLFSSAASAADILEWGRRLDREIYLPLHKHYSFAHYDRSPERVLRVGWLSSDIRSHAVGTFIAPLLPCLDTSRVESYVYYSWPSEDEVTSMAKRSVRVWRNVCGMGDNTLAECIRDDDIDILVDLNGHTAGHRLGALARKPAPIQVEWLGFPGTSGLSAMDYVLVPADDFLRDESWSSETPWVLPNCYGVREGMPQIRLREGLPCEKNASFTFACMNRYSKVSAASFDVWARILSQTDNTKLMLIGRGGDDETAVARLRERFNVAGIDAERLIILPSLPVLDYYELYNRVDLCLDPFPFNGGTTGFDSIWMGVPFVTLRGRSLHSRAGSNILKHVGLTDLIADSERGYVEKAVALAGDLDALRGYRANLRGRMQASPLMDCNGFARGIENVFRSMWKKWLTPQALPRIFSSKFVSS
jgi:predicted O-linked N-acetylglucosamine transferase (SPINDLY family)